MPIISSKLKNNDNVRVIAPSRSLALPWINGQLKEIAEQRFKDLGLNLSFGEHVNDIDEFDSSAIAVRVDDLHRAFADKSIKMIITAIGGYNSNQLLRYLDYDLIKNNPKIFCGYSDITALTNAIYAKTGLVTYSGPQFFTFGDKKSFDYTLEYFNKCLLAEDSFEIKPSLEWSNDRWGQDQKNRRFVKNEGYWTINEGKTSGKILGGNQCTFNLLQGTEFMPDLAESILFIEDDNEAKIGSIDRDLQSIIHQPGFDGVKGIVFGRFQPETKMTRQLLTKIVKTKKELSDLPIIANVDFGHTYPMITFPVGGTVTLEARDDSIKIEIINH